MVTILADSAENAQMHSCAGPFGHLHMSPVHLPSPRGTRTSEGHVALRPWDLALMGTLSIGSHIGFLLVCLS